MSKYVYKLILNSESKRAKTYTYDYGSTKGIKLAIARNSVVISADLTKKYERQKAISKDGYIFPDALRKALLIHIILFSENITVKSVTYKINNESEIVYYNEKEPPIYSMVTGKLIHKFKHKWADESIETVLKQPKSKYDSRTAALFALICSKSKIYEAERFVYLWMAFNGMYSYFSSLIEREAGITIRREWKELSNLQKLYDLGGEIISDQKEKNIIAKKVSAIIKGTPDEITKEYLFSDKGKVFCEKIKHILIRQTSDKKDKPYEVEPYGYLLVQYAYYFRCTIIHADNPVLLFSFSDDGELRCLQTINRLLEDFIEENLNLWFSEKYCTDVLIPKAKEI